jgi:hypothetical protein
VHQVGQVEAEGLIFQVVLVVKRQYAQQHHHAAHQGVNDELDGGVSFPRAAPDADDEIHRHQHGFPEYEKQQQIERHEHAQHGRLQQQEQRVVFLQPDGDGVPTGKNRQEADERSEHHQQQAEPVDAQMVAGSDRGNPGGAFDELKIAPGLVAKYQRQRNQKPGQRGGIRPKLNQPWIGGGEREQHHQSDQRREQDYG